MSWFRFFLRKKQNPHKSGNIITFVLFTEKKRLQRLTFFRGCGILFISFEKRGRIMPKGERIFEKAGFNACGHILPIDEFKLFADREKGLSINPEYYPAIIAEGEKLLNTEFPVLLATQYMMFCETGNRSQFESRYFPRRDGLLALTLAEYVEGKGRFIDKIIDLSWMIMEETSWVLPAHNRSKQNPVGHSPLPDTYDGEYEYIDLFAGTTGATLAFTRYLLKDALDKRTPMIADRMERELEKRIVRPFLDLSAVYRRMGYTGINGGTVNNWCPWIISNVLTVTALVEKDMGRRTAVANQAMQYLDNFTSGYHTDGGCDEGPGYWSGAGGALYNAMLVLRDMSGGYIDAFGVDLVRKMGEYITKVIVTSKKFLCVSDCSPNVNPDAALIYDWGTLCGSEPMKSMGQARLNGELHPISFSSSFPYTAYRLLSSEKLPKAELKTLKHFFLDGIQIGAIRESENPDQGLYCMLKGGHNNESHNHNDVGEVTVYADGQPIFIDVGGSTYTKKTFSEHRYEIWSMRSEYHNCMAPGGIGEEPGPQARAKDALYNEETGELSLDLTEAYPAGAKVEKYRRGISLENKKVHIFDNVKMTEPTVIEFHYMVETEPKVVSETSFRIHGRTVTIDPSLTYEVETVDCFEETSCIPNGWHTDAIRRIIIKTKQPVTGGEFTTVIE